MSIMIRNAADAIAACREKQIGLDEAAILYEMTVSGSSRGSVLERMQYRLNEMRVSVSTGLSDERGRASCRMFAGDAKKLMTYQSAHEPFSGTVAKAAAYALSVMEINCSMGRIVAAPTAGSCGVLPAVILAVMDEKGLADETGVNGLLSAGLVGIIIGKNAFLSGASGGCQAEVGSAAAMGAAAVVTMAGGTPEQAFDAGAIALKAMMGLVCDPVAGLVEVPCAKRNAMGAGNALLAADMVLSGIKSVIPFDEVVWAMKKVGQAMPGTLKETAEGGVAATPTGRRLKNEIFGN